MHLTFMKRLLLALWLCAVLANPVLAENLTFFGPGYGIGLSQPKGWLESQPSFAVVLFHPKGTTPDNSPVVIYARVVAKSEVNVKTVSELNKLDVDGMKNEWPRIASHAIGSARSVDGVEGSLYEFTGGRFHEFVAYFDQGNTVTLIVLSKEGFSPMPVEIKTWKALFASYRWLPELSGN